MNLQQLSVFREVMETGSVSDAARNLNRTQPAISAALKTLESNLGIALFRREGRRLTPVPEAHYLLSEATQILDRVSQTEAHLRDLYNRERGTLRIAAMPGTSAFLLPDFLSRFIADRTAIRTTMTTRSSPQILNLVAAQNYDVGFCDLEVAEDKRHLCAARQLYGDCMVAVPAGHPLAGRPVITAADLDGQPMGTLQTGHHIIDLTERAFARAGARFVIRVQTQFFFPLFHFIESGSICAVVDPMSAESYRRMQGDRARIHFARFEPAVGFGYTIVTPSQRPLSNLAQDFVVQWTAYVGDILA